MEISGAWGEKEMSQREETYSVKHNIKGLVPKQYAVIYFVNGKFISCDYHVETLPYTQIDWEFMGIISKKIATLIPLEKERYEKVRKIKK